MTIGAFTKYYHNEIFFYFYFCFISKEDMISGISSENGITLLQYSLSNQEKTTYHIS